MPEGPEVFTFSQSLQPLVGRSVVSAELLSGRYIRHGPPVNFQPFCESLPATILSVQCKGKLLYMTLDETRSIWFTLAMTGAIRRHPGTHDRVQFRLSPCSEGQDQDDVFYFSDIRNFGTVTFGLSSEELDKKLRGIGKSFVGGGDQLLEVEFVAAVRSLKPEKAIAAFLMEQKRVSGVGNYVLSEALYRARLYPFITAGEMSDENLHQLYVAVVSVVAESVAANGATLKKGGTYRGFDLQEGGFSMRVYGRTEDPDGRKIVKETGPHKRSLWWVPELQAPRLRRDRPPQLKSDSDHPG